MPICLHMSMTVLIYKGGVVHRVCKAKNYLLCDLETPSLNDDNKLFKALDQAHNLPQAAFSKQVFTIFKTLFL